MRWRSARPLEHDIQAAYFNLVDRESARDHRFASIYAIPNARKASIAALLYYRAEGMRKGVPDVCIPVANELRPGAYIEFKRPGEKLRDEQKTWAELLKKLGHAVSVQYDALEAFEWTKRYLRNEL